MVWGNQAEIGYPRLDALFENPIGAENDPKQPFLVTKAFALARRTLAARSRFNHLVYLAPFRMMLDLLEEKGCPVEV